MTKAVTVYQAREERRAYGTAREHYEGNRAKAIFMLDRMLSNLQADRQSRDTATVNWGDSGTMADYVERLQHIHDAMFHEGEHAPENNR